ncbi:Uracil-DNA glycosylase, family 4 [hydrothermal vent metagenome]|uniref:Type-4 uracil-DNA glycosylase n=1 Tax=hydrothermal vent metagenome TaxID=652676 RepID=A0A3B1DBS7_9ZZZZ
MSEDIKYWLKTALAEQRETFGDELFEQIDIPDLTVNGSNTVYRDANDTAQKTSTIVSETTDLFNSDLMSYKTLDELYENIHDCQKCSLGATRNKFVFGVGNPNADLMLIGEAPGADEDKQGIPFVGRAGKLLTDILKAINFEREEVYIANILKCRPPNNRDPLPSEREVCKPYLFRQIELIKPKIILCLGKVASNVMLNNNDSLTKMRSEDHELNGIKLMVTYHPAALLRNPHWKKGTWEDVQKVRKLYDELTGS